jgi:HD superfamily phosphodiesterase
MIRSAEEEERILNSVRELMGPAYKLGVARGGHDVTHPQRMEKTADVIMNPVDPRYPADPLLVKLSIWYHDIHRTSYFDHFKEGEKDGFIINILSGLGLLHNEIVLVINAVKKHSRLNEDSDSPVLVYLKDIDHLDMGAIGILRIAAHHQIPPYNLEDFLGKMPADQDEKLESHVEDIKFCLEWEKMLRTEGAKNLGKRRFAFMRQFLQEVERELRELGEIP